jgi:GT2 family glycosyltransferase
MRVKMISVVVVYNNKDVLENVLLQSIKKQRTKPELILLDNTKGQFRSASHALNYGGSLAKGKYIMFVHQDVELEGDSWLEDAEKVLDSLRDLGIAGVVGMSEKGKTNRERGRGYINDGGEMWLWSNPVHQPEDVQTLDECLLIVPKSVFEKLQFDERTFDGWHCYGIDYCLCVREIGLKAYVIPFFIYHRTSRSNVKDLLKYQKRLYRKHRRFYKRIVTTSGEVNWFSLKVTLTGMAFMKRFYLIYKIFRYFYRLMSKKNEQMSKK